MPESIATPPVAPPPAVPKSPGSSTPRPTPQANEMPDVDAFAQLDSIVAEPTPKAPEKPVEAPKTEEPAKPVEKAQEKPPEKPAEKPKTDEPPKPQKAATLRENYDRLKGELKQAQERLAAYEAEKAKIPQQDNHLKELQAKYEALQKKHDERENEFKFVAFERSQEYKDKYEAPFIDAYTAGRNKVASLKIAERKNDVDEVVQQSRPATAADFDALMQVSDDDQAAQMAQDLFGAKAPMVLYHRERVQELNAARLKAIEDYRKQGSEREKTIQDQTKKQQEESVQLYQQTVKAAKDNPRYKEFFAPVEGDTYGNTLLDQGEALADLAHGMLAEQDIGKLPKPVIEKIKAGQFDEKERVKLHAAVRNKFAAFDRLAYKYRTALKQIEELQKSLSDYEESTPPAGEGGGRTAPASGDSMEEVLAGMDKYVT